MANTDTVELLRECDAGTKMAVDSIGEVLDKVHDSKLKNLLTQSKEQHEKLGNAAHSQLRTLGSDEKDPNPIAKSMSWMKTNLKLGMDDTDAAVAGLMTDGCNMGSKSLNKYLNQYSAADNTAKSICKELIFTEDHLRMDLREYL
ncbi:hypothetical protein OBV_21820 [Oscillibacter valericigenes Sjm18-20]|nr:hypothetical protein OBV_21820 [Oscillibacter valericigenes Sjm18-20]